MPASGLGSCPVRLVILIYSDFHTSLPRTVFHDSLKLIENWLVCFKQDVMVVSELPESNTKLEIIQTLFCRMLPALDTMFPISITMQIF